MRPVWGEEEQNLLHTMTLESVCVCMCVYALSVLQSSSRNKTIPSFLLSSPFFLFSFFSGKGTVSGCLVPVLSGLFALVYWLGWVVR